MAKERIPAELVHCRAFLDADAPTTLDYLIPNLRSRFLTSTIMQENEVKGRRVCMRDHINVLITMELPEAKLLGFVAAEVNPDTDFAALHIIYVLRLFRGRGVSKLLIDAYEQLLERLGCTKTAVAPITDRSLALFKSRASSPGAIKWNVYEPTAQQLASGNAEVAND